MDWLKNSIMMTKGVGKNSDGETHHLTEKVQGTYQYTMGPYSDPVMSIKPVSYTHLTLPTICSV